MKKILTSLICILTSVCLIFGCSLNVLADDGWGTEDAGVYAPHNNYVRYYKAYTEKSGCPNGDFSQGYRYWTTDYNNPDAPGGKQANEASRLEKDGDNTYVVMTPRYQYNNIATVMFTDDRIKLDDKITVLYDWHNPAGDAHLQVIVSQYILDSNGKYVPGGFSRIADASDGGVKDLKVAFNDTDWNTSMSRQRRDLLDPSEKGDGKFYFSITIECTTDFTDVGTKVDNLRLARFNKTTGDVLDLDGKKLYNINELEMGADIEDDIPTEDFDNIDYEAENEEIAKQDKTEDEAEGKSFIAKYLVWIIVGGGVLLLIVAAVVVVIIVAAKKKKAAATDEPTETTEENETINE